MPAATLDLQIEQGATFERTLTLRDENGALINLTGKTFRGQLRRTFSDAVLAASFTFTILNQTTNTGQVKVSLTATDTAALKVNPATNHFKQATPYAYDIEMVDGSDVRRIMEGTAHVSPEVTK